MLGTDGAPVLPLVVEQPAGGLIEMQAEGNEEGLQPGNVEPQPPAAPPDQLQPQGNEGENVEQI